MRREKPARRVFSCAEVWEDACILIRLRRRKIVLIFLPNTAVTRGHSRLPPQIIYRYYYTQVYVVYRMVPASRIELLFKAYESSVLTVELRRLGCSIYSIFHSEIKQKIVKNTISLVLFTILLRDLESNQGLQVMSLTRYRSSIPLYIMTL